jgi:hypothetical protein
MSRLPTSRLRRPAEYDDALLDNDPRAAQAASIQAEMSAGRELIAEVFADMPLSPNKVEGIVEARAQVAEHWGKAKHSFLLIGQTLLRLSRTLSETEFRRLRRGTERLFPFSDSVATRLRLAALKAEEWRLSVDQAPPYTLLYEISTLPLEGQQLVRERGLLRPDMKRADIVAVRAELKAHKLHAALPVLRVDALSSKATVSKREIEERRAAAIAERAELARRLAELDTEIAAFDDQLALL